MQNLTVVSSRVRLARNIEGLPFDLSSRPEDAQAMVTRVVSAMCTMPLYDSFRLYMMHDLQENQRDILRESHMISTDFQKHTGSGAVLVDEKDRLSVMIHEEDHVRILSMTEGDDLKRAMDQAFQVDDALSRQIRFAFTPDLGYLTARPVNTGTGLRASMRLHLPMAVHFKQIGSVYQIAARYGLNCRFACGEGSEGPGCLYEISNQKCLGVTEQETISSILTVAGQLEDMESLLRSRLMADERLWTEDQVYRAYSVLRSCRLLEEKEFLTFWSSLRLGMRLGMIRPDYLLMERLLEETGDGHLTAYGEKPRGESNLSALRAQYVREQVRNLEAPLL